MNIDQRLEALTQTVELLAHSVTKHDEVLVRHERLMGDIMDGVARLVPTAELHPERLDRHARRLDSLEDQT